VAAGWVAALEEEEVVVGRPPDNGTCDDVSFPSEISHLSVHLRTALIGVSERH
jgi:hypothetical protein